MIDGGYSSVKIASKLGNDLTKMDIYHRWTGYLTFLLDFTEITSLYAQDSNQRFPSILLTR
jgi:hypothetical protein